MYCPGCGAESLTRLCESCNQDVVCKDCNDLYKRGAGLVDVDLCPRCLNEALAPPECPPHPWEDDFNGYEEYGFDYRWEAN